MLEQGALLGGRYRLKERLGEGGMGTVWVAENLSIRGAEAAVKVLHDQFARDPDVVRRFRQEAEAAVRIGHPHIVKVFDYGETPDGAPFLVMERLLGESLADHLTRVGAMPPRDAAELVCDVLDALEAAHARGVLHRDLKPENIFLVREGDVVVPKILDFGVSKFLGDDAERVKMTRTGALVGTPAYMSPEQAMGEHVDLRSDLWAMGVILYELVTARLPYEGQNFHQMLIRIATTPPKPATAYVTDLDPSLAAILERALARSPDDRFQSARALRDTLRGWLRGEVSASSIPRPRGDDVARATPMAMAHDATLPGNTVPPMLPALRAPWWIYAAAVAVLGFAGVTWIRAPRRGRVRARAVAEAMAMRQLTIENLPRDAARHVTVDGQPVMLTPQGSTTVGVGAHSVEVRVPGYAPWMGVTPTASGDVTLRWSPAAVDEPRVARPTLPPGPTIATTLPTLPTHPPRPHVAAPSRRPDVTPHPSQATRNPNGMLATTPGF